MKDLSHVKGPKKEGQRKTKYSATKTDYVENLDKQTDDIHGNIEDLKLTATPVENGLMSKEDKIKLNGITEGANNYLLPAATETKLGGVKIGKNITNNNGTISVPAASSGVAGVVKIYNSTGSSTDGTINQNVITQELNDKLNRDENAAGATKLATSRTFQTNLASNAAAVFDGTANNTHGVTGTLGVANGGTGQTSLANVTVGAATKATQDGSGNVITSTYLTKTAADGYYLGKTATAAAATKATQDGSGNNIANTYLKKTDYLQSACLIKKSSNNTGQFFTDGKSFSFFTGCTPDSAVNSKGFINLGVENAGGEYTTGTGIEFSYRAYVLLRNFNVTVGVHYFGLSPLNISCVEITGTNIIRVNGTNYEFKDDGIYLNGTKITN